MAGNRSTARRYAEAAFEIAERDGTLAVWLDALDRAAAIVADPELGRLLSNPAIPAASRREVLENVLSGRIDAAPMRLVGLLLERGRIERLPEVARELRRLQRRKDGITEAVVTSAAPLTEAEVSALRDRLTAITGGAVEFTLGVDPALLGGVEVRLGDRLIDGSVRGRLDRLRTRLASGAL